MSETAEKKVSKKAKKKSDVRLPSKALYGFAIAVLKPTVGRYFRQKVTYEGMEDLKAPFIVLSNHCTRIDWALVGIAMHRYRLNAVLTRYYYSIPALRFFLRKIGGIPKDQFSPDVAAVKSMLATAKLGGNIMLFPEGRMAPGGVSETFEKSTVKLLRHLKVPVVGIHHYGFYMAWPKWAKTIRRGRIDTHVKLLLTPEKIAEMTDDEIYEIMVDYLKTDEAAWQKEHRVAYKGRRFAEGLHDVLFYCPKCGAEHRMVTGGDVIRCEACGNGAQLNRYYDLVPLDDSCVIPESIGAWYELQVDKVRELIAQQPDTYMTDTATLLMTTEKRWLNPVGEGTIRADANGFTYTGQKDGQPFELEIPLSALPAVAYSQGRSFEMYYKGEFYSFEPKRPIECQRWSIFIEQMHSAVCADGQNRQLC